MQPKLIEVSISSARHKRGQSQRHDDRSGRCARWRPQKAPSSAHGTTDVGDVGIEKDQPPTPISKPSSSGFTRAFQRDDVQRVSTFDVQPKRMKIVKAGLRNIEETPGEPNDPRTQFSDPTAKWLPVDGGTPARNRASVSKTHEPVAAVVRLPQEWRDDYACAQSLGLDLSPIMKTRLPITGKVSICARRQKRSDRHRICARTKSTARAVTMN